LQSQVARKIGVRICSHQTTLKRSNAHKQKNIMKKLFILTSCALALSVNAAVPDSLAVRAIIGEAGNQPLAAQRAIASVIRSRGSLKGIYGVNNPCVSKATETTRKRASQAWKDSASVDYSHGAMFFGCKADDVYFNAHHFKLVFTIKQINFWKE